VRDTLGIVRSSRDDEVRDRGLVLADVLDGASGGAVQPLGYKRSRGTIPQGAAAAFLLLSVAACHPLSRDEQQFALAVIHSRERLGKGA